MDVDAFAQANAATWARLRQLVGTSHLTGAEADELVLLFQRTATHLSQLRSGAPEPALVSELSVLLATAQGRIAGAHDRSWTAVRRFIEVTMPVALYRIRWWAVGVGAFFAVVAVTAGIWVNIEPEALALLGTPDARAEYVDHAFEAYYTTYSRASFGAMVWTNNAWLALICIATGITGILPLFLLVTNAVSVGAAGGLMVHAGAGDVFFSLIAPHGLLELSSLFVAGAAGLRLFWVWLVPGGLPRSRALAVEGRSTIVIVLATAISLLVSGVCEGFVTPCGLPWWLKGAIGAAVCAGFWAYIWLSGGRAVRRGHDAEPSEAPRPVPIATA
jgi:uncharacterized membrane protein SpoIIM required for sporulation